ncbi:SusD/RagB family nutrient-binding outer membrane lipoprotein [Dinghuibacter silviterrae]|uniref:SusD-like starch-binding protein associating with outer membrane n=1 Tax=Dinghuibacter silviterrae TaxID=1539049 RepID=A0A4R8DN61_9BACT|nr:SusD/RagB family nutrient-binding outer membrane lipoprotein [Dinghuibacter silviterrae]TDW99135.1 SusD-like starch-binding protein associating with outer membrane [Dinghuibacter silviterrae]
MKKSAIIIIASAAITVMGASCKKYLNINTNPNSPTASKPDYVLPEAIVYTAANASGFNTYGAETAGMQANAGGYGGFGDWWTYDWGTSDYTNLWSGTYDALQDFQYVINETKDSADMAYYTAIGDIMKAYNFELLVDAYNNCPYSQALKAPAIVSPKYDSASAIYVGLANLLDTAINLINNAPSDVVAMPASSDPMFGGTMATWKQFANTVKLRLIIRASSVISFPNTTFDAAGFLTTDAIVNPGYNKGSGSGGATQQNPNWDSWVAHYDNSTANRAWMACLYAFGFYNGQKLNDGARMRAIYYDCDSINPANGYYAYANQLGYGGPISISFAPSFTNAWYCTSFGQSPSSITSTNSLGGNIGIMKDPTQGQPLILAAESYFLQAEANLRGIVTGSAQTNFNAGIVASYNYLYELANGSLAAGFNPADSAVAYQAANATSYLANYGVATSDAQRLEAIITQKYIAVNMITSQEAWNEYRRTRYPVSSSFTSNPYTSMVSTLSQATRPDKLPTRIMYPNTEYSSNASNVPASVSPYTSLIFWALP